MVRSAPPEPPPGLPPEETDPGERYLTLMGHLQELRYRVMVSAGAVVVGLCISAVFASRMIVFLEQPAKDQAPAGFQFQFIEPFELFSTYLKVSLFGGVVLGLPFIIYHTLRFVSPGVTSDAGFTGAHSARRRSSSPGSPSPTSWRSRRPCTSL
jgi:Sec-independent protein secretion pathway component TatC